MKNSRIYLFLKSNLFFFLLLTIVVFSLYGKSINFDFTYHDDNSLISEKTEFLSNFKNIPKLFITSCYYSGDFQYYRPILNLSFLIETTIFGLNTKIYHLTNIILFIFTLFFMYIFLVKLNLNQTILKFLILLISFHPIFTSSAVWIPARNDTLLAVFIFLSFIFFVKYLENKSTKNLIVYIFFFSMALFTKETALLTLLLYPLFIICFEYKLIKNEIYKNILILIPIVIIYFCLRNISVQSVTLKYYFDNILLCSNSFVTGISTYLYNFFIPHNIPVMLYKTSLTSGKIVVSILVLTVLIFVYYKNGVNRKKIIFSLFWFIAFLFTIFLLQDYVYLNHRLVISLFGIILMATYAIDVLITKYNKVTKYLLILVIILFPAFFSYSFNLQDKYKNKYEYWINAYLDAPKYHAASYYIAHLYIEQKNYSKAKDFLIEANKYGDYRYLSDLALLYYYEGDVDKAEEIYKKAIESGINKAQCYRNLSTIYLKRDEDINKAMKYAKLAVQEEPYDDGYKQYLQNLTEFYKKSINEKNNI